MMENYSLSDIRAAAGNDNGYGGWGGDGLIWLVVLFLFGFGGFGGFGNRDGFGGAATAAAQNEILLGQNFDRVQQKLDGISGGICDGFYALNNSVKDCCCNTQLGIASLDAKIDHQTGEIIKMFKDNEITNLRDKIADLQIQASQCRQNEYLVGKLTPPCPVPAYITCSPYQSYNPGCCGCGGYGGNF